MDIQERIAKLEARLKYLKATKAVVVPRKVLKSLGKSLAKERQAVVCTGRKGTFKVYRLSAYESSRKASSETAKKHQPWKHARVAK